MSTDLEVSSCFIDDGHEPTGPNNMMMREAHHINYNYITDNKLFDKKEEMCVLDNFLGVYSPIIKKMYQ